MTEQEAYPLKLKYEMNKLGVDAPTSLLPPGDEEEQKFGMPPYWEEYFGEEYEGTPERTFAEAKRRDVVEGRAGTVPYHLDPDWLRANRSIAMQVLESRGIMLEEDEIDAFIESAGRRAELPLEDKSLDVGVRAEFRLPTITSDAEYDALPSGSEFIDPEGNRRRKP